MRDQALVVAQPGTLAQADAGRDLQARREVAAVDRLDRRPQLLGHRRRFVRACAGEQQRELLAAPARHPLFGGPARHRVLRHLLDHGPRDAPEGLVADVVRVAVVDALEVVDVQQAKAQRLVVRHGVLVGPGQALVHAAAVRQAGQRVGAREQLEHLGLLADGLVLELELAVLLAQRPRAIVDDAAELRLARLELVHPGAVQRVQEQRQQRARHRQEPGPLVEARLDLEIDRGRFRAPAAAALGGADLEAVLARRQVGVLRIAAGVALDPAVVEAFEPVAVADLLGRAVAQAHVVELELAGAGRQHQAAGGAGAGVVHAQAFDHHRRRRQLVARQLVGLDHGHALGGGDPDAAVGGAQRGRAGATVALGAAHAVGFGELLVVQAIAGAIGHRLHVVAADVHHAGVGAEPEIAVTVDDHLEHRVHRQPLAATDDAQFAAAQAPHQAAVGGEPQRAVGVLVHAEHVLGAVHRRQVDRGDLVAADAAGAVGSADPEAFVGGFEQAEHELARQPVLLAKHEAGAVLAPQQAARGADPKRAIAAFVHGAHLVRRQAVAGRHLLEQHAVAPAQQAGGIGAHPDVAGLVLGDAQHRVRGEFRRIGDLLVAPAVHAAAGADQDFALAGLQQRAYVVIGQALVAVDGDEGRVGEAHQAGIGAHPQAALAVGEQ